MDPFMILMTLALLAGLLVLTWALRGRRDRPTRATWGALAIGYLLTGFGLSVLTLQPSVFLVFMLLPLVAYPVGLIIYRRRERADARSRRNLMLEQGVPLAEARRLTKITPLGFAPTIAIYGCASFYWIAAFGLFAWLVDEDLIEGPTFRIPSNDPTTAPYDMPWWLGVFAAITVVGTIHAFANMIRRDT